MATENLDTEYLLQLLQQGSERAFTDIYDRFSKPLYRNIVRMVKDEAIAEELLQDLFLKFWIKRADLNPSKPLKPYLYKMAANLVYNHFRKVAQDKRLIDQLMLFATENPGNTEDQMIARETHELLLKVIDILPPQRKQVFLLCKLEGKSYSEVSAVMGISQATINEHIVKGNKAIKKYFLSSREMAVLLIATYLIK